MIRLEMFPDNTSIIELQDLTNIVTEEIVTDAVVTATLLDSKGDEVAGQTWPLTLSYVSVGIYRGVIEDDVEIVANRIYTAIVDASVAGVGVFHSEDKVQARKREAAVST